MFPHALTVYPATVTVDADGNPVRQPAVEGIDAIGHVQPVTGRDTADGQPIARFLILLDATAPRLDATSRVDFAGRTLETVGEPMFLANPDESVSFWHLSARSIDS